MLPRHTLLALLAALQVYAVPLNINLGAYSPALVVGDGEISFGGAQNAGALMETLASGAAANAAGGAAQGQRPQGQQQQGGQKEGGQQQPAAQQPQAGETTPGAPAAQAPAAEAAAVETNAADGDPARSIAQGLDGRAPNMAKRSQDDAVLAAATPSLEDVESQILEQARKIKIKREINGFREALAYAREAQKTQPKVELGSEGAGVGIVVNAGLSVPANSAANGAGAGGKAGEKRDVPEAEPEQKQGITLLAIAEI